MKKYPLYIAGTEKGSLSISQDKLHLIFSAECEYTDKLVRISVFGGGKSAYLGVMKPEGNKLTLKRKMSKNELMDFPKPIEYAADKAVEEEKSFDTVWYEAQNGTLISSDEDNPLIAIPSDIRSPRGCDLRIINGREYLVFPGKRKRWQNMRRCDKINLRGDEYADDRPDSKKAR